jgi:hypothetical protein
MAGFCVHVLVWLALSAVGARASLADAPAAPAPSTPPPAALPPDHPPIVPGATHKKSAAVPITPELIAKLPPPAARQIDFVKDIKPLFDASCVQCHAKGKVKGGLSLETRETMLTGGEDGPVVVPGKSAESRMVHMVAALDPETVMPQKGTKWTAEQVALLRAWIDQGAAWDAAVTFKRAEPINLKPRPVVLPDGSDAHPIDRLLTAYFSSKGVTPPPVVEDAAFARRAYLDVIGLPPTAEQLDAFVNDGAAGKRAKLVKTLLADNLNYADHWLTFWNDLLRNDYRGTGYIDGGRKQISGWLYSALLTNKPYDQFVAELLNPTPASEGFMRGIVWRGAVNASMAPHMQAAQNVSQVFLGVNLKCASCHDSFVSDWTLADAYSFAAVFADKPLEMVRCDKPTGQTATPRILYPQLGALDEKQPKAERLKQFAALMTDPKNGRLPRTVVNRLWAKLIGRGLVEPLDDMEKPAWNADLLDWLAEDLVANKYDVKHTLELILTSRAYQLPTVESPKEGDKTEYVFRGPYTRRLSAEQFADAVSSMTGQWADFPSSPEFDFSGGAKVINFKLPGWVWTNEPLEPGVRRGAWQLAMARAGEAQALAATAQKLVGEGSPEATAAAARAKAAAEAAAKVMVEAEGILQSPERIAQVIAAPEKLSPGAAAVVRHKVTFRRKFVIDGNPADAYGAIAASQRAEVIVNGKKVGSVRPAPGAKGRAAILDLRPLLAKGENVIVINVDSHTEKAGAAEDAPQLAQHLNGRSGVAFFARYRIVDRLLELMTDATWRVRRAPEADPTGAKFDDASWASARVLDGGAVPLDEGPALDPAGKPAEGGLDLGQCLPTAVAGAVRAGHIRAALVTSNPLLAALDRPNREVVVPVRSISATTIQALEMTNGATLDDKLKASSAKLAAEAAKDPGRWVEEVYRHALARKPTEAEKKLALETLGNPVKPEGVADVLWAIAMLPEFQLVN